MLIKNLLALVGSRSHVLVFTKNNHVHYAVSSLKGFPLLCLPAKDCKHELRARADRVWAQRCKMQALSTWGAQQSFPTL